MHEMKVKFILTILSLVVIVCLIGCSTVAIENPEIGEQEKELTDIEEPVEEEINNESQQTELETDELNNETEEESKTIEVDKGILSVEITLPASLLEGEDIDDISSKADDSDMEVTVNDDGSVACKMSKSKHKEIMTELYNAQLEFFEEIKNSEDIESIEDIKYNETFSEIIVMVDQEAFEGSFDLLVAISLGASSSYYQLFNGVNPDDCKARIYFKDIATGEILVNLVYPDDFGEIGQ